MIEKPALNQAPIKINRALLSVFDKTGVVELAQSLHQHGVEILSTGGTAKALRYVDIPVTDVSDYTKFPEIMDGRVKTINPLVEGGILGLRDKHGADAEANEIKWIDLVVCNLYPFSGSVWWLTQPIIISFRMKQCQEKLPLKPAVDYRQKPLVTQPNTTPLFIIM